MGFSPWIKLAGYESKLDSLLTHLARNENQPGGRVGF